MSDQVHVVVIERDENSNIEDVKVFTGYSLAAVAATAVASTYWDYTATYHVFKGEQLGDAVEYIEQKRDEYRKTQSDEFKAHRAKLDFEYHLKILESFRSDLSPKVYETRLDLLKKQYGQP